VTRARTSTSFDPCTWPTASRTMGTFCGFASRTRAATDWEEGAVAALAALSPRSHADSAAARISAAAARTAVLVCVMFPSARVVVPDACPL